MKNLLHPDSELASSSRLVALAAGLCRGGNRGELKCACSAGMMDCFWYKPGDSGDSTPTIEGFMGPLETDFDGSLDFGCRPFRGVLTGNVSYGLDGEKLDADDPVNWL